MAVLLMLRRLLPASAPAARALLCAAAVQMPAEAALAVLLGRQGVHGALSVGQAGPQEALGTQGCLWQQLVLQQLLLCGTDWAAALQEMALVAAAGLLGQLCCLLGQQVRPLLLVLLVMGMVLLRIWVRLLVYVLVLLLPLVLPLLILLVLQLACPELRRWCLHGRRGP